MKTWYWSRRVTLDMKNLTGVGKCGQAHSPPLLFLHKQRRDKDDILYKLSVGLSFKKKTLINFVIDNLKNIVKFSFCPFLLGLF